jgi:filamentous hemagglutinin
MHDAAKRKTHLPASLAAVRLLLLLIVACCGLETRVWSFAAAPQPASGQIALATPSFIGEIYDGNAYDASDSLVAAKGVTRPTTTVLSDVTVISKGKVVGRGDVYLRPTLEGIESGKITPRDIFQNREGLLPAKPPGYYQEFVHPTPGVSGAGSQRIIRGSGGELYYTPDHYGSFVPLN